jgi:hypothetical protein
MRSVGGCERIAARAEPHRRLRVHLKRFRPVHRNRNGIILPPRKAPDLLDLRVDFRNWRAFPTEAYGNVREIRSRTNT